MPECEQAVSPVQFFVDVEFDDQPVGSTFGPVSTTAAADSLLVTLAGRSDVKKATLRKEVI